MLLVREYSITFKSICKPRLLENSSLRGPRVTNGAIHANRVFDVTVFFNLSPDNDTDARKCGLGNTTSLKLTAVLQREGCFIFSDGNETKIWRNVCLKHTKETNTDRQPTK